MQKEFTTLLFSSPDAVENPPAAFAALFERNDISLTEQLKVYRNHVVISLSKALAMTFPLVEKLAGRDFLMDAAKMYLREHPPMEACLDRYGGGFPDFLRHAPQANATPYLADAAALDWLINESKCAKDDPVLRAEDLAAIAPDAYADTVFVLRDNVKLIRSPYPLHAIYNYDESSDEELDITGPETFLLVTRLGLDVKIFNLNSDEFMMFEQLEDGKPLGECLEVVMAVHPAFNFAEFLQNYIALETFSAFVPKG